MNYQNHQTDPVGVKRDPARVSTEDTRTLRNRNQRARFRREALWLDLQQAQPG